MARVSQETTLDGMPRIDGLSAVGGNLLVMTVDERVLCFETAN
jgi:hypothetical protein